MLSDELKEIQQSIDMIKRGLETHADHDVEAMLTIVAGELDRVIVYLAGDDSDAVTPEQGLAFARFLRRMPRDQHAFVTRGGQGLGPNYLLVQMSDGYTGGIDREGRTST